MNYGTPQRKVFVKVKAFEEVKYWISTPTYGENGGDSQNHQGDSFPYLQYNLKRQNTNQWWQSAFPWFMNQFSVFLVKDCHHSWKETKYRGVLLPVYFFARACGLFCVPSVLVCKQCTKRYSLFEPKFYLKIHKGTTATVTCCWGGSAFSSDCSNHKVYTTLEYKPANSTEEERKTIDHDTIVSW